MRSMASGVYIAGKLKSPIKVYWEKNDECYARFDELFKPLESGLSTGSDLAASLQTAGFVSIMPESRHLWYMEYSRKKNLYLPGLARTLSFDRQISGKKECTDESVFEKIHGGKIFIISAYSLTKHFPLKSLFVPTDEIQSKIDSITGNFAGRTIGIHIRRGDNYMSINKNTAEDYSCFIDETIEKSPDVKFFLATDSEEIKKNLVEKYGSRILYNDSVLERNSVRGMKDAVVDLCCLSRTEKIIGSYYSSFSDLAAELGNIDLTIL